MASYVHYRVNKSFLLVANPIADTALLG